MFPGTFSTFPTVQYGRHAHKDQNFYCFPFRENQSAYYKRIKKIRLFRFDVNNNKNIIILSFGYKSQKKNEIQLVKNTSRRYYMYAMFIQIIKKIRCT